MFDLYPSLFVDFLNKLKNWSVKKQMKSICSKNSSFTHFLIHRRNSIEQKWILVSYWDFLRENLTSLTIRKFSRLLAQFFLYYHLCTFQVICNAKSL